MGALEMKAQNWVRTGLVVVSASLLFGCSIQDQPTQAPPSATGMPSPSSTPTSTPRPAPTAPPTQTPTPIPTDTPTPLPTLDPDEVEAYVREMLQTNAGCELPCWWGITPGETSWEEMEAAFLDLGISVENGRLDLKSWNTATGYRLEIEFEREDDLVRSVSVGNYGWYHTLIQDDFADTWQRYALHQVLSRHGVPSEVYLVLDRQDYHYGMFVVYDDQGIGFLYPGIRISDVGGWLICPVFGQVEEFAMQLQSPAADTPIAPREHDDEWFYVEGRLAELTGMDVQAFHEAFSRPDPQTCAFVTDPLMPFYDDLVQPPSAPTFSREEEDAFLVHMLATNGGCELPCWWGITPGVTSWQEAQQMFLSYGKGIAFYSDSVAQLGGARQVGLFGHHDPYPFDYIVVHRLYEQDGTVQQIGVLGHTLRGLSPRHFAQDWQRYTLDGALTHFGKPSQVLLHYFSDIPDSHYSVGVMYEEMGVLIEYMGFLELEMEDDKRYSSHPDPVVICPTRDRITDINLWLQSPDAETPLADTFIRSLGGYHGARHRYQPASLEEATGMSLDEFCTTFQNPNAQDCLEASPAYGSLSE